MVGKIVDGRNPELLESEDHRFGKPTHVPDVDEIRFMLFDCREEGAVVVRFEFLEIGNVQPRMTVEAVNAQGAFDGLFRLGWFALHDVIGREDLNVVAASAELVDRHVADQLISPEVVRRIKIG